MKQKSYKLLNVEDNPVTFLLSLAPIGPVVSEMIDSLRMMTQLVMTDVK